MKTYLLISIAMTQAILMVKLTPTTDNQPENKLWRKENESQLLNHFFRIRQLKNVLKQIFRKLEKKKIIAGETILVNIKAEKFVKPMRGSVQSIEQKTKKEHKKVTVKESAEKAEMKWFSRIN